MLKNLILLAALYLFTVSCNKSPLTELIQPTPPPVNAFVQYTILAGNQYCDLTRFEAANYTELKFVVKFDSSAIYQNKDTLNQGDINKLFGFSDNDSAHHRFSARFGWGWFNKVLSLHAYVYNNGNITKRYLGDVAIGKEHNCSIKVMPGEYVFTLNGVQFEVPRTSTTATGKGYKLYPYFGGDEVAPHNIRIWIKEI